MTLEEAIKARHSVRAYKAQPLAEDIVKVLEKEIEEQNRPGHLHIQLVKNEPKAFQGKLAKYGKFSNVTNYLVMAGQKTEDLDERIGYYGEHLVLLAQTLGLNTCWVGLSYSKIPGTYVLEEGEVIKAYIAIGYGETQGVGHKIKTVEKVSRSAVRTLGSSKNASDITPKKLLTDRLYTDGSRHSEVSFRDRCGKGQLRMDINHTQSQCRCSYHQRVQADAGVQGCDLREDENGGLFLQSDLLHPISGNPRAWE